MINMNLADISAKKAMHSAIVTKHLTKRYNNKILQALPSNICSSEETHPRHTCRALAQLRTNRVDEHRGVVKLLAKWSNSMAAEEITEQSDHLRCPPCYRRWWVDDNNHLCFAYVVCMLPQYNVFFHPSLR